jgi:hypothetical protein
MYKTLLATLTATALSTVAIEAAPAVRAEPLDAATLDSERYAVRQPFMVIDRTTLGRNVLPLKRDGLIEIVIGPSKCAAMLKG